MGKYLVLSGVFLLSVWYLMSLWKDRKQAVAILNKAENFCYLAVDSHIRVYLINGMYPVRIKNTCDHPAATKMYKMEYQRPITVTYALRKRNWMMQNLHSQKLKQNINAIPDHVYVFTTQINDRQIIATLEDQTKGR